MFIWSINTSLYLCYVFASFKKIKTENEAHYIMSSLFKMAAHVLQSRL